MDSMIENIQLLDRADIEYLEKMMIDENGIVKILPYKKYKNIPQEHITQVCIKHGLYNIPTEELINFLKEQIYPYLLSTIEIGAGNGATSMALKILATDSYMQDNKAIKDKYEAFGQAITKYGTNVINMDGNRAVNFHKPRVVIAAWVTHKYNPAEHWREGNMFGVMEESIIKKVSKYIFIGNEHAHRNKPILDLPHKTYKFDWLLSRSLEKEKNTIWVWGKS